MKNSLKYLEGINQTACVSPDMLAFSVGNQMRLTNLQVDYFFKVRNDSKVNNGWVYKFRGMIAALKYLKNQGKNLLYIDDDVLFDNTNLDLLVPDAEEHIKNGFVTERRSSKSRGCSVHRRVTDYFYPQHKAFSTMFDFVDQEYVFDYPYNNIDVVFDFDESEFMDIEGAFCTKKRFFDTVFNRLPFVGKGEDMLFDKLDEIRSVNSGVIYIPYAMINMVLKAYEYLDNLFTVCNTDTKMQEWVSLNCANHLGDEFFIQNNVTLSSMAFTYEQLYLPQFLNVRKVFRLIGQPCHYQHYFGDGKRKDLRFSRLYNAHDKTFVHDLTKLVDQPVESGGPSNEGFIITNQGIVRKDSLDNKTSGNVFNYLQSDDKYGYNEKRNFKAFSGSGIHI